jgi:hypothetical protein
MYEPRRFSGASGPGDSPDLSHFSFAKDPVVGNGSTWKTSMP